MKFRIAALCAFTVLAVAMCIGDTHLLGVMTTNTEPETIMNYTIQEQTEGRGEDKEIVLIKRVGMVPSIDKKTNELSFVRLKSAKGNPLPCLKIVLSDGRPDHMFNFMWSNHAEQHDETSPGTFKLVRVDLGVPLMKYIKDVMNNRIVLDRNGRKMIDYVAMAQDYDSHYDPKTGWTFGPNQPMEKTTEVMWETADIERANELLEMRFGEDLTSEMVCLLMDHELFRKFLLEPAIAA